VNAELTVSPRRTRSGRDPHPRRGEGLTAAQLQGVAQVRRATTALHDIAATRRAGYTEQYPAGCAQSASGM
jgi:hypothetical protein